MEIFNNFWYIVCVFQISLLFIIFSIYISIPLCIYLLIWHFNIYTASIIGGYAIWVLFFDYDTCEKGSFRYRSRLIRSNRFLDIQSYFPATLTKAEDFKLDPKKNYLFCTMPHGIVTSGAFLSFATDILGCYDLFPQIKNFSLCTIPYLFRIPFFREYAMSLGICSVSKKSLNYLLSLPGGGNATVIVIGGLRELMYTQPGTNRLYVKNRKGFVKLALKHGTPLVPVFSFGETDLFQVYPSEVKSFWRSVQTFLFEHTGFPFFISFGYGLLPYNVPLNVVVGAPIEVPQIDEPISSEINHYHELFIQKTIELFESQKHKYIKNAKEAKLEFL